MREWLESKRFYWFTLTFDFTPLPYHWQVEWTDYGWGYRGIFGPFGFMVLFPERRDLWKRNKEEFKEQ